MFKQTFIVILLTIVCLSLSKNLFSQSFPQYKGFVNDFANIIDAKTEDLLETKLNDFEKKTSHEVVIATVSNLEGTTIEDYANRLFEKWKIGKKNKDNGILILVAPNERKVRIEVGYGLEGVLPDAKSGRIIDEYMVPHFRKGSYEDGIVKGTEIIMGVVGGEDLPASTRNTRQDDGGWFISFFIFGAVILQYLAAFLGRSKEIWPGGVLGAILGLIVGLLFFSGLFILPVVMGFTVIGLLLDYILSKNYKERAERGLTNTWWGSGGGFLGGKGSSFGGGFRGFGGGTSGGGGSSRSW